MLENKIKELDSLERIELELEIEKKLAAKADKQTREYLRNYVGANFPIDALLDALDKRYVKKQP